MLHTPCLHTALSTAQREGKGPRDPREGQALLLTHHPGGTLTRPIKAPPLGCGAPKPTTEAKSLRPLGTEAQPRPGRWSSHSPGPHSALVATGHIWSAIREQPSQPLSKGRAAGTPRRSMVCIWGALRGASDQRSSEELVGRGSERVPLPSLSPHMYRGALQRTTGFRPQETHCK